MNTAIAISNPTLDYGFQSNETLLLQNISCLVKEFNKSLDLYYLKSFIAWRNSETGKSDYFSFFRYSPKKQKLNFYIKSPTQASPFEGWEDDDVSETIKWTQSYKAFRIAFTTDEIQSGNINPAHLNFIQNHLRDAYENRTCGKGKGRSYIYG